MRNFVISPDGFPYILLLLAITIITGFINIFAAIIPFIFLIFVTFFFRNPPRKIKKDDKIILSPADGKILSITEIDEDEYLKCKAVKVSIFLSLFNVHVNRTPIAGKVEYIKYRPGKFLPAFKSHASEINERNTIGLNNGDIKVLVHQITGFIARRIVSWVKIGDVLQQGQLYGLIKFGSCTEIVIPIDRVELKVKEGDAVKGGLTIIGVIRDEN